MERLGRFDPDILQQQIVEYRRYLNEFFQVSGFQPLLIGKLDHVALKAYDLADYEQFRDSLLPFCTKASQFQMDNRWLATFKLVEKISLSDDEQTDTLELMQPRKEKVGRDFVGLEHSEFYYPVLTVIESRLRGRQTSYGYYENPSHQALVIIISNKRHELKITNSHLANIVDIQVKANQAVPLKGY